MANQNPSPATRFARGKSGNPGGRPRGESLTARLRRYLDGRDKDGRHRAERLAQKIAELALSGGIQAIRLVLDRMEGKVTERIETKTLGVTTVRVVCEDQAIDTTGTG